MEFCFFSQPSSCTGVHLIGDHFIGRSLCMLRAETVSVTGPCIPLPDRCMFDSLQHNLSGVVLRTNDVRGSTLTEAALSIL